MPKSEENRDQWKTVAALRDRFINDHQSLAKDYWRSEYELSCYDKTLAQRIGWKWDAVILEAKDRGIETWPNKPLLFDWGCGSGIASRKFLRAYGPESFVGVQLFDRSQKAMEYAEKRLREEFGSSIRIEFGDNPKSSFVFLASHVLNELNVETKKCLQMHASQADVSFFVEPGTPKESYQLALLREELRQTLNVISPCTHQEICGMLTSNEGKDKDWCHFFAKTPSEISRDAEWSEFAKKLRIDLRSLPVSFLILSKEFAKDKKPIDASPAASLRVLGRPKTLKMGMQCIACSEPGIEKYLVSKKADPECYQKLKKGCFAVRCDRVSMTEP